MPKVVFDNGKYRLVDKGPGYRTNTPEYVVEELSKDAMNEIFWKFHKKLTPQGEQRFGELSDSVMAVPTTLFLDLLDKLKEQSETISRLMAKQAPSQETEQQSFEP